MLQQKATNETKLATNSNYSMKYNNMINFAQAHMSAYSVQS